MEAAREVLRGGSPLAERRTDNGHGCPRQTTRVAGPGTGLFHPAQLQ